MLKKKASHKGVNTMRDFGNHIQVCLHSQICLFLKLGDGAVKNWGEQWPCLWWPCFGVSCGSSCVWDGLQDTGGFARFITVHAQYFSCVQFFETPQTSAPQVPLSMEFSRQEYWSGLPFPSPGIFPTQGSNLCLPSLRHRRSILYPWATGEALGSLLTLVLISRASSIVIEMLYSVIWAVAFTTKPL